MSDMSSWSNRRLPLSQRMPTMCVPVFLKYGVSRSVRETIRRSDAAHRILSAISTGFWLLHSFGCHGDDVRLHHRFRPVETILTAAQLILHISTAAGCHHPVCLRRSDSQPLIDLSPVFSSKMREIVHLQAGQCGNQIGAKVVICFILALWKHSCRFPHRATSVGAH